MDGKIAFGGKFHRKRKRYPHRDVHEISNVQIKNDDIPRFKSHNMKTYADLELRRGRTIELSPGGEIVPIDSEDALAAGVSSPLKKLNEEKMKHNNSPTLSRQHSVTGYKAKGKVYDNNSMYYNQNNELPKTLENQRYISTKSSSDINNNEPLSIKPNALIHRKRGSLNEKEAIDLYQRR